MIQQLSFKHWKDPESRNRAHILTKGMISVLLIVTLSFLTVSFIQSNYIPRYALIMFITWSVTAGLVFSLKEENVRRIAVLYISFLLLMVVGFSWTGGGIKGHGIGLLPVVVAFAGLTVGSKQIWTFSIAAGVGGLLLMIASYTNMLRVTEPLGSTPLVYWIFSVTCTFSLTYLEFLSVNRLQRSLDETKKELALRQESETNFRRIIESFQDVYYQSDMQGRITMITPSIKTRTGFEPDELIGKDVKDFYADPDKRDKFLQQLAADKTVYDYDLDLLTKSGEIINVTASSRIIYADDGTLLGIEGTLHDITERKKAENYLRIQNEGLIDIAFLQSHIVRAPLTNILGLVSLINKEDPNDPINQEMIPQIETAAKQLDSVIYQIVQKTNEIRAAVEKRAEDEGK